VSKLFKKYLTLHVDNSKQQKWISRCEKKEWNTLNKKKHNNTMIDLGPIWPGTHQKVSRFFGPRYIGDDFFLGPNLVSFNRAVIPYEISKVNFRIETKILVSMSEEI
jgi:hypothetical protein